MPVIELKTTIHAPIQRCFDLSRSIDLHADSMAHTNEKPIAGRTSGLIEVNETVTWSARHFGITQQLTSLITDVESPTFFADEMVKGAFKRFRHEHHFSESNGTTTLIDLFDYTSPLGPLGQVFDLLVLKKYMRNLLVRRNDALKHCAESEKWRELIPLIS